MKSFIRFTIPSLLLIALISCRSGENTGEEKAQTVTPVTVTKITIGMLADTIQLNATSAFLLKTTVKSATNGYIQQVFIKPGDRVSQGQVLFKIRTKEAASIGNVITTMDSSFHFKGLAEIKSPANGYITQLSSQAGDYVQDGESIATVSDQHSLVFLLDLPYELSPYINNNKHLTLVLPDGRKIPGTVSSSMPSVDPVSQTQNYILRMDQYPNIPENLIAKVQFVRKEKPNAVSLPKDAVLTDEQQTEFWIMKLIDSHTAVKVPVKKGMETSGRIEILQPALSTSDEILLTGNYGMPDTAKVRVESN